MGKRKRGRKYHHNSKFQMETIRFYGFFVKILSSQTGKRTESDTDRKNGQELMINITIVKFVWIPG